MEKFIIDHFLVMDFYKSFKTQLKKAVLKPRL